MAKTVGTAHSFPDHASVNCLLLSKSPAADIEAGNELEPHASKTQL